MPASRDDRENRFERQVAALAREFAYPPTPRILHAGTARVRGRHARLSWSLAAVLGLVLLAASLLASPVRARLAEWLQIGVVRIFPGEQTAFPTAAAPTGFVEPSGRTTLEEAQRAAGFVLQAPEVLGAPDRVYYQEIDRARLVILLWFDQGDGMMALHQVAGAVSIYDKRYPGEIVETTVEGEWGVWVQGPYQLMIENGKAIDVRTVEGNTLIWQKEGVTYRFESMLDLDSARRIGETLRPVQP